MTSNLVTVGVGVLAKVALVLVREPVDNHPELVDEVPHDVGSGVLLGDGLLPDQVWSLTQF